MVGLCRSLRAELAPRGVGVSGVCPNLIAADIIRGAPVSTSPDELKDRVARAVAALGAPPSTVARAIVDAARRDRAFVPVTAPSPRVPGSAGAYRRSCPARAP